MSRPPFAFSEGILNEPAETPAMTELTQAQDHNPRPKPPNPEDVELRFSEKAVGQLEALKKHYPDLKSLILPVLWIAQR